MPLVQLLYWILCYTLVSMGLLVAFGRLVLLRNIREAAHALLVLAQFLLLAGGTAHKILDLPETGKELFGFLGLSAICLILLALPVLIIGFSKPLTCKTSWLRHAVTGNMILIGLLIVIWPTKWRSSLAVVLYIFLILLIVTILVHSLATHKKPAHLAIDNFWRRLTRGAGWASLIYLPLFIIFDFFMPIYSPDHFTFSFFPVFFVIWSSLVTIESLRQAIEYQHDLLEIRIKLEQTTELDHARKSGERLSEDKMNQFTLSKREREAIRYLAEGLSYKEIASAMFVSEATIKTHIAKAYLKVGCGSKVEVINKLMCD